MKKRFFNLQLFDTDAQIIDRSGAEALIPEDRAKEIIQGAIEQSAVLSVGRRLADMTTAQNKLPVLDSLPIAYFVNGDTGAKKTTKQAWDKKVIYAEEIAVIVPIPEAVLDDADYDIWGEVKPRVQEAFGKVIDAAILFGDGKPTNWRVWCPLRRLRALPWSWATTFSLTCSARVASSPRWRSPASS